MGPDNAPTGMGNATLVLLQLEGTAEKPLKVTVFVPRFAPKLVPVTVTVPPTGAVAGDTVVMTGITKKDVAPLATPATVTITSALPGGRLPGTGATIFVADHEIGTLATPPTVIELVL